MQPSGGTYSNDTIISDFISQAESEGIQTALETFLNRMRHQKFQRYMQGVEHLPPELAERRLKIFRAWQKVAGEADVAIDILTIAYCTGKSYKVTT